MSTPCQKIEIIRRIPELVADDITNFTSAVCAVVTTMSSYNVDSALFETWASTYSANYQATYNTVKSNSADWTQTISFNVITGDLSISNGNTVSLSSLSGGSAVDLSLVEAASASWQNTTSVVQTNSSIWILSGISVETDPVFTSWLNSNSATIGSLYSTVNGNSAVTWNYQGTDLKELSAKWESSSNTVQANSATTWNYQGSDVKALTAFWQNAYNTVQANSSLWILSGISVETDPVFTAWAQSYSATFLTDVTADARYVNITGDVMTGGLSAPSLSTNNLYVNENTIFFQNNAGVVVNSLNSQDVFNFSSNHTTVSTNSANWNTAFNFSTVFANNSALYNSTYTTVATKSANWNSSSTLSGILKGTGSSVTTAVAGLDYLVGGAATIASSTTTDIGATNAGVVTITGTTTITSLGVAPEGDRKILIFTGALILVHNATSLIIPSAANFTTVAGDIISVRSLGAGNWRFDPLMWDSAGFMTNFGRQFGTNLRPVGTLRAGNITGSNLVATSNIGAGTLSYIGWTSNSKMRSLVNGIIEMMDDALTTYAQVNLGFMRLATQTTSPTALLTGQVFVYAKTDGKVYRKDETGVEIELGGSSTDISGLSARWESSYTSVNSNSATWSAAYTNLFSNSAAYLSSPDLTLVRNTSASWTIAYTNLISNSAAYLSSPDLTSVRNTSANWNAVYSTVLVNSAITWNYQGSDLKALSANWESTRTTVGTNSSNWNSAFTYGTVFSNNSALYANVITTVQANSATTWNYQGSDLKALSSNWQSTFNTVLANSAAWALSGGSGSGSMILSYNRWQLTGAPPTSVFTIAGAVLDIEESYRVTIDAVIQDPFTYTVNSVADTITFNSVPPASAKIIVLETYTIPGSGQEVDPKFTTWANTYSALYQGTYTTVLTNSAGWALSGGGGSGLTYLTETLHTASPNNTDNAVELAVTGGSTNADLVLNPKGTGALIGFRRPDATTIGGDKRGAYAVDFQGPFRNGAADVASGISSTIIGGRYNRATAAYAVVAGYLCWATGQSSFVAGGQQANATSFASFAAGYLTNSSGSGSFVAGGEGSTASANSAHAQGQYALADRFAMAAHGSGRFAAAGDAQSATFVLRNKTTNATATELFLDGSTTRLTVPSGKIMALICNIAGVKSDGSSCSQYLRQLVIKNVAGTTALVGTVQTIGTDIESNPSTDVLITANDTNDALKIEVTGIASETWRWVATIQATEIAYGV